MEGMRDERLDALLATRDERELFAKMQRIARELEFEYCAYALRLPLPLSRPRIVWLNDYDDRWQRRYVDRNYFQVDPTFLQGMKSALPIVWSEKHVRQAPEFWEEAHAFGIRHGWTQAAHCGGGSVGMLSFARSAGAITRSEMRGKCAAMGQFAQYLHAVMAELLLPRHVQECLAEITMREKEVLSWTAEGKTAFEIAKILSLSERTVNFHVNNVVAKLGASNKTHAAAKAVALGLLR